MAFKIKTLLCLILLAATPFAKTFAQTDLLNLPLPESAAALKTSDTDKDGLSDFEELNIYHTNPNSADTDSDGYVDGDEVKFGFDPNKAGDDRLQKNIIVTLADQSLSYFLGGYLIGTFKISSGKEKMDTPTGEYQILKKLPVIDYKGKNYDYKNTRWNMMFKKQAGGNLYIHGAYWHNNFGQPMSHGCVNVSYENIEPLYNWADVGTKVTIK